MPLFLGSFVWCACLFGYTGKVNFLIASSSGSAHPSRRADPADRVIAKWANSGDITSESSRRFTCFVTYGPHQLDARRRVVPQRFTQHALHYYIPSDSIVQSMVICVYSIRLEFSWATTLPTIWLQSSILVLLLFSCFVFLFHHY